MVSSFNGQRNKLCPWTDASVGGMWDWNFLQATINDIRVEGWLSEPPFL